MLIAPQPLWMQHILGTILKARTESQPQKQTRALPSLYLQPDPPGQVAENTDFVPRVDHLAKKKSSLSCQEYKRE